MFLEKYKCSIYEVRPVICRMYGMCLPCGLIKNKEVVFQEGRDLTNIQLIIGDEIIKQRNYPLFYFFSFFLSEEYYHITMKKLSMIRSRTEKGYADFTRMVKV
ncbi:hypothetical protein IL096_002699 [Enterococcus hirae]|nr:hypothetical protein [Enterococcus hirae]